jgi:hypothetical protein
MLNNQPARKADKGRNADSSGNKADRCLGEGGAKAVSKWSDYVNLMTYRPCGHAFGTGAAYFE